MKVYPVLSSGDIHVDASSYNTRSREMKCPDCYGYGEHCYGGKSAHPSNWYKCRACDGTGRLGQPAPLHEIFASEEAAQKYVDEHSGEEGTEYELEYMTVTVKE